MRTIKHRFLVRASVMAVQGALAALVAFPIAHAEESEDVLELTRPTNVIEAGIGYVNHDSAKFGEYNGLNREGAYFIGGFDVKGGAYGLESDSAYRWQVTGTNLGLNNRSITGDLGNQGQYRLTFGYDELQRNYSDRFVTPYSGEGSTQLTLPGYPAAAARPAVWNNIQNAAPANAIISRLHNFDIETQRRRHELGLSMFLTPEVEFTAGIRHEEKDGTKLTGVDFGQFRGALVPEPIDFRTDSFETGLAYNMKDGRIQANYSGSFFQNGTNSWTVANPFQGTPAGGAIGVSAQDRAWLGGAPDSQAHQLSLTGLYKFSPATRLVVSGSYARNTQDERFVPVPTAASIPGTSLQGLVVKKNFDAKLTTRASNALNITAAYKYDDRDNRTPVRTYVVTGYADFTAANVGPHTNEPINRKLQQFNLDGDYALGLGQAVRAGYERQEIERSCSGPETECFDVNKTKEDTVRVEYRKTMADALTGRVGYSYSQRRGEEFSDPRVLVRGAFRTFLADRNRDRLRTSLEYQASNALSIQAGLDYNMDDYKNTRFGLTEARSWVLNLDSTYAMSEDLSTNVFYSFEDVRSQISGNAATVPGTNPIVPANLGCPAVITGTNQPTNADADPCRNWTSAPKDRVHTVGLGVKHKRLMAGKLELAGNVAYSRARSPIDMGGAAYYSNGTNLVLVPAQSFPDVSSTMVDFRLDGRYALSKASAVRVNYLFRQLKGSDWQYDSYAAFGPTAVQAYIGPGITAPKYAVQVVGVSYLYSFR